MTKITEEDKEAIEQMALAALELVTDSTDVGWMIQAVPGRMIMMIAEDMEPMKAALYMKAVASMTNSLKNIYASMV